MRHKCVRCVAKGTTLSQFVMSVRSRIDKVQGLGVGCLRKGTTTQRSGSPRLMHRALLPGDEEYWHYVDKVFHD